MTLEDRGELPPQVRVGISLGLGPPRRRAGARDLDELGNLAALEEADARKRVLAREQRIVEPRDLAGPLPVREHAFTGVAELAHELAGNAIAAEVDPQLGRDQLCRDPRLAQLATHREL